MNCCDANGNCNQGRDCPVRKARSEAGTFQIVDLSHDEWTPVTLGQFVRLIAPAIALLVVVIVVGFGVGYVTEHHSEILWQLLSEVS